MRVLNFMVVNLGSTELCLNCAVALKFNESKINNINEI